MALSNLKTNKGIWEFFPALGNLIELNLFALTHTDELPGPPKVNSKI